MTDRFPAEDREIFIDFGEDGPFGPFAADLHFAGADQVVTFRVTRGSLLDKTEALPYTAQPIAAGIWLVTWQEADLLTVVQVQNFNTGRVTSAVTTADQQFVLLDGALGFR